MAGKPIKNEPKLVLSSISDRGCWRFLGTRVEDFCHWTDLEPRVGRKSSFHRSRLEREFWLNPDNGRGCLDERDESVLSLDHLHLETLLSDTEKDLSRTGPNLPSFQWLRQRPNSPELSCTLEPFSELLTHRNTTIMTMFLEGYLVEENVK